MPDSAELKQKLPFKKPEKAGGRSIIIPMPRIMGFFIMLVTALAFIAGGLRNELAITLLGTVLLTILVYCYLGILLLGLIYRGKARSISMAVVPDTVNVGEEAELLIKAGHAAENAAGIIYAADSGRVGSGAGRKNRFWSFPAILVRCELRLQTKDGRVIRHYADPGVNESRKFHVKERGVFYGEDDKFVICDAPGFFSLALPLHREKNPRLTAVPRPAEEPVSFPLKSGGAEERHEPHYRKSDEYIDHRPYVPGDDPRRINWKLYSHAPLGELFVREGESEPPPNSRLIILIDSEIDDSLYTADEGRQAVDLLCENALAAALEFSGRGMDISIGWTGGQIIGNKKEGGPLSAAELASALAWPAAVFPAHKQKLHGTKSFGVELPGALLPNAPRNSPVLILALPRAYAGISSQEAPALDSFLKNREPKQEADIVFIYDIENKKAAELEECAMVCVNLYNRRSGVHAGRIPVSRAQEGAGG